MESVRKTAKIHEIALAKKAEAERLKAVADNLQRRADEAAAKAAAIVVPPKVVEVVTPEERARLARIKSADAVLSRLNAILSRL